MNNCDITLWVGIATPFNQRLIYNFPGIYFSYIPALPYMIRLHKVTHELVIQSYRHWLHNTNIK